MTDPTWRAAEPRDDARVIELVERLYAEDPSDETIPRENTERTLAALRADPVRGKAVVAEAKDGVIVGYALLISFWSNEFGGEICEIDELYVLPDHRSRGIGTALIDRIGRGGEPWARSPVALALAVTPKNARALALYERLGFARAKNTTMRRRPA